MREGSLEAPTRHALGWQDPAFYDEAALDAEMRRQMDVCHGCRRCFNLCDSFPRLFELIDQAPSGELDTVDSAGFEPVVDACTLCDLCYMTKCPYVPPHEFAIDFPHLMLRYRAVQHASGKTPWTLAQLTETDRNGTMARHVAPLANWASDVESTLPRVALEKVMKVDRRAVLPKFHSKTFQQSAQDMPIEVNQEAPGFGRKAVLYATCFVNYNNPAIGLAARRVLAHNGVETQVVYPECCGMPQLEQGDIPRVAKKATAVAESLLPWVEQGYDIIALVPSCALMLKLEWPLILPDSEPVKALSKATFDLSEYIVEIAQSEGLSQGLQALEGGVSIHIACHARAQNMGHKAAQMLRLIPQTSVHVVERCSGHGGSWGMMKDNFDVAVKVGRPVAQSISEKQSAHVASECPLAALHIAQGMTLLEGENHKQNGLASVEHPIEIFARAYGLLA